jgi:Molecular chaperone
MTIAVTAGDMSPADSPTVGIDLGTTRTAVAHVTEETPTLLANAGGYELTPSVVHVPRDGPAVVGREASDRLLMEPDRTVAEVKRQMGEETELGIGQSVYRPEELSALILEKVVGDAADRLDTTIGAAVITVPAYFTGRQRTATRNAGEIAGLHVDQLLPEPSAAVLAYGYEQQKLGVVADETLLVYDLGGGTFDATLVEAEYEHNYVETVFTEGNSGLGGGDWTAEVEAWVADEIRADTGIDITGRSEYADQRNRVRSAAREAKHDLVDQQKTVMNIPYVVPEENYHFERTLDRAQFQAMTEDLLGQTRHTVETVFDQTEYTPADVDTVLLVGGASRMPQVAAMLRSYFGMAPSREVHPDQAVAMGAAVQAAVLDDSATEVGGMLSSADGDTGDEPSGIVLVDVLPQTLGVELESGLFSPVIEQGAQLPTTVRKETYRTIDPNQTSVTWPIRQGESTQAVDNDLLGEVVIRDIPPRDPDRDSLAIEFTMTSDGTLQVAVEDLITGTLVDSTVESGIRLADDEIDELNAGLPGVE